jgi:arsenate reductase-like glutaredoxin family protein
MANTVKKTNTTTKDELTKKNKELEEKVNTLLSKIENLTNNKTTSIQQNMYDISLNKVVPVVSLFYGGLTLKTAKSGGHEYRFEKFGDLRPIVYQDLLNCISTQNRFFREGFVYIMDQDVVSANNLNDFYKKILSKEQIEDLLNKNNETIRALFSNTTSTIQQTIVDLILEKIRTKQNLDSNKVNIISEIYGRDLYKLADIDSAIMLLATEQ